MTQNMTNILVYIVIVASTLILILNVAFKQTVIKPFGIEGELQEMEVELNQFRQELDEDVSRFDHQYQSHCLWIFLVMPNLKKA